MQCAGGYRTVQQETLEIVLLLAAVALNSLKTRKIGKIAYKCFSYKSTEKPFYLYFKFKGATDSYGNTWPHDKYNSQRRSLWYL